MLKELRKKAGLTQKELGDKVGVSESAISVYEAGTRIPPKKLWKPLAVAFNVTEEELLKCFIG